VHDAWNSWLGSAKAAQEETHAHACTHQQQQGGRELCGIAGWAIQGLLRKRHTHIRIAAATKRAPSCAPTCRGPCSDMGICCAPCPAHAMPNVLTWAYAVPNVLTWACRAACSDVGICCAACPDVGICCAACATRASCGGLEDGRPEKHPPVHIMQTLLRTCCSMHIHTFTYTRHACHAMGCTRHRRKRPNL